MREAVQEYYGKVLSGSADLKTSACSTSCAPGGDLRALMANVHPEVNERYYGCGLVYPAALEGARVLDLGCGTGRDCYVLAQLVGPRGEVVGVDMTDEQLAVADRHIDWHREKFGYARSNVSFHKGFIEKLDELPLDAASFDVIVSNCVLNLSVDKPAVLRGAQRLLREGGEMYFSDVYASRRVPAALARDPVLYGECLGGALYWNDFEHLARDAGFGAPRLVEDAPIAITDPTIAARTAGIAFYAATYRLFKLADLEPACEDYGQAVIYRGSIAGQETQWALDKHHVFERDRVVPVSGNTWRLLHDTRFEPHFEFVGTRNTHYGIFAAGDVAMPYDDDAPAGASASCC